jgi:chromosome segregation ATPase
MLRKGKARIDKGLDELKKTKAQNDADNAKLEATNRALRGEIANLTKELGDLKKQSDQDSKDITDIMHERDILSKNVMTGDERTKTQIELVSRHEGQANTLEKDLKRWKFELQRKLHRIHELDKQREKYASELGVAKGRCEDAAEELKNRDATMALLKKSLNDVKAKLTQQKNLYEAVKTDKSLYSKNLIESQEDIAEMKKKFKVMYLQIEQLKEEIKEKERQIVDQHFALQGKSKEKENTQANLERQKKLQKKAQEAVEEQQQQIKKLEATIREIEVERQTQKKEFEAVTSERNILGTQLIRRNEELTLLYEKIKIQESTLKKGEAQYKGRLEDLRLQRESLAQLKLDLILAKQDAENTDDLKKEVYHLQRELLLERTKVKALSEELENPMNVHRWRKLEGSDPAMYELIQKVRTLQMRLIAKTEEVVSKDMEISEKERLHKELTAVLEKQPGPEVMEQLEQYQETFAAKMKQMKAMQSELQTYQAQVCDYKDEIDRLTRELQEVKKKYFDQKKREQVQSDFQRGDPKVIHPRPVPQVRFTGGGFNLAH